jgi:glycosyltransferase involved in cell wall biosynthesis
MLTVNDSIAKLYHDEFGVEVKVMRNLPTKSTAATFKTKKELGLPDNEPIILLQGAGINIDRGAEEAVEAMQYVTKGVLLIIGDGDAILSLKERTQKLSLNEKVKFIGKLPLEELKQYTALADIGLTLDKDTNINYRYSLPNKLFDYIHAGVPVLATPLVEVKQIIDTYQVGECVDACNAKEIALKINSLLTNKDKLISYKQNTLKAKEELCWENEKKVLTSLL